MKPRIDSTKFGSIKIDGETFENDVVIRLDGEIEKRKKKLSKAVYGTSHTISLDEAKHLYQEGADKLIIGTGQTGQVKLSDDAEAYFKKNKCRVKLFPTPEAIRAWNKAEGSVLGMFHVTG